MSHPDTDRVVWTGFVEGKGRVMKAKGEGETHSWTKTRLQPLPWAHTYSVTDASNHPLNHHQILVQHKRPI